VVIFLQNVKFGVVTCDIMATCPVLQQLAVSSFRGSKDVAVVKENQQDTGPTGADIAFQCLTNPPPFAILAAGLAPDLDPIP
jgi:hypothetical protein